MNRLAALDPCLLVSYHLCRCRSRLHISPKARFGSRLATNRSALLRAHMRLRFRTVPCAPNSGMRGRARGKVPVELGVGIPPEDLPAHLRGPGANYSFINVPLSFLFAAVRDV